MKELEPDRAEQSLRTRRGELRRRPGLLSRRHWRTGDFALGFDPLAVVLGCLAGLLLFGCASPPDIELPTLGPSFTPTPIRPATLPPPPKTLVVCLRDEPASLYLYSPAYLSGSGGGEVDTILQAIYDGPLDIRRFEYEPVILERAPSLSGGDARIQSVTVAEGGVYFNPETLEPDSLQPGRQYLPTGCREMTCAIMYAGGEVALDQLVVEFKLIDGLLWSDGAALTADDSVYSYQIEAALETPSTKFLVNNTQSYESLDELTLRWTGIPGFMDNEYRGNFWSPLPEHLLQGKTPAALLEDEGANKRPIGWGPYTIDSWDPGKLIHLTRNPNYFRADEGLPAYEFLIFRFLGEDLESAIEQLITGECDILDESVLSPGQLSTLNTLAGEGRLVLEWTPGSLLERLEFNLGPSQGVSLVKEVETRRALSACIDRQGIVDQVFEGIAQVSLTYLPTGHPLYLEPVGGVASDPAAGREALEAAGWVVPSAGGGVVRGAQGISGVADGTALAFTLLTPSGEVNEVVANQVKENLGACGVDVSIEVLDPALFLSEWPDGPVFGRGFGLVAWAWPTLVSPVCETFLTGQVPSDDSPLGINASGFSDAEYDSACQSLLLNLPDAAAFDDGARKTQQIIADQVPAIPLFVRPRLMAHSTDLCGTEIDPTASSGLWNLETIQSAEDCPPGP